MEKTDIIPLVCAAVVSNRMPGDPVWLMIVGGSSSGKTEIINCLSGIEFVRELSMLTPNTLLSGMKPSKGVETSFLKKLPRQAVVTMKEFTTLLSGRSDDTMEIMGQLREVYDGKMTKETGNGISNKWEGKVTLIAGVTEKIYQMEGKFSGMGTRTLNYVLPEQDRMKTARRSAEIADTIQESREEMKQAFNEFITSILKKDNSGYKLSTEQSERLLSVCNFASKARSPVERDFNGRLDLVLSPEMPMRMSNMLHRLGAALMAVRESNEMLESDEKILHKIALDSIPKGRRMCLKIMGTYAHVYTSSLAREIGYPIARTRLWLEELNAIGVCTRESVGGSKGDKWTLKSEFMDMVAVYEGVQKIEAPLEEDEGAITDSGYEYDSSGF